ncbi:MAG: hypothetical protein ACXVB0_19830 [Mucilaginibacter sp.]
MYKKLPLLLLTVICSSCIKTQKKAACGTQVCTDIFVSVGIQFTDKNNNRIAISNFTALDLRTNKTFVHAANPSGNTLAGYEIVVDDSDLKDLSSEGDNISVSAKNPVTGEIKTAVLKVSGGCNCHVAKVSGPDTIAFN